MTMRHISRFLEPENGHRMKNKRVAGLLLMALFASSACCASPVASTPLIGKWRSDRALTVNYFVAHFKTTPAATLYLKETTGYLTLAFTKDHLKADAPGFDVHVQGKLAHAGPSHAESAYTVVSADAKSVSISIIQSGKPATKTYNFDGKNTLWIDTHGVPSREYYTRVR